MVVVVVVAHWCTSMSRARPVWPASAAQMAESPRRAGARGSLRDMVWRWAKPPGSQLAEALRQLVFKMKADLHALKAAS